MRKKSFTLVEILIISIIVGILSTIGVTQYFPARERALDAEAKVNLKLIQAAMKIYGMEVGGFFNSGDAAELNQDLKLALPARNWVYSTEEATGDVSATRKDSPAGWDRIWNLTNIGDGEPICVSGRCP